MRSYIYLLLGLVSLTSCQLYDADLVIHNATVFTVNENFEVASAFAVKNGKFIAVGDEEIVKQYKAKATLDFNGLPVFPGFIDAHCHFYQLGLGQNQVELRGAKSIEEVVDRLRAHDQKNNPKVLVGRGWDQNLWEDKSFPTKTFLDNAFPDKMVVLERVDGHATWVNSVVLNKAGITASTQIDGGEVILKKGQPTGVLIDNASSLAYSVLPQPSRKEQIEALKQAEKIALSYGLTTVDDAGLNRSQLELIDSLHNTGDLKMRVYGMISNTKANLDHYLEKGISQTERLTIRSVKVYADGALGSRGAALKKPYHDDPTNRGLFITPAEEISTLAQLLSAKGFQMNTHAIGDAANQAVLDAYTEALEEVKDPRWRIEHAQVVDEGDLQKFGPKVIPSVQPTHATSDMEWADERLGSKRIKTAYRFKEMLDWSGSVALGTDFPVEKVNPLLTFYAAIARKDTLGAPTGGFQVENALSRSEALKGMTVWAAHANFEEQQKGSIEAGKVADFVLMTSNIMLVKESDILDSEVMATFLNGEMVYQRKRP